LVKNRNKVKVHYLKDYESKDELFTKLVFWPPLNPLLVKGGEFLGEFILLRAFYVFD
jgi:hypothetical protein